MNKKIIIMGAGGHAKVIADIIIKSGDQLLGFLDDNQIGSLIGYPILGKLSDSIIYKDSAEFIIGIGNNMIRNTISSQYDLTWYTAIHPSTQIGMNVHIGKGSALMANSVINTCAVIGKHCIINTATVVEHDNVIGDFVHLSPNVTLGGSVKIGNYVHVGIGATIINNLMICDSTLVGAGGIVLKNIEEKGTYVGVPVKKVRKI